jgi:hypothetical protein
MPDEQPTIHESPAHDTAAYAQQTPAYEPIEEADEWSQEPESPELPRRPRRRLLGVGASPIPLALIGVLLIAGGFIAGVQVQKGQTSSGSAGSAPASLASRFAALGGGTSSIGKTSSTGGASGGFPGASAGGGRPTTGTVAYLAGDTLYVTNSEGNTVKVKTSAGTSVTKTVKTKVKRIFPGETVTVTGVTSAGGTVSAESISVGSSSSSGLAALLGGSATSSKSGGASAGSGAAALFGSG